MENLKWKLTETEISWRWYSKIVKQQQQQQQQKSYIDI